MSYLTQMVGLTVQNFVSAAVGMAVLVALIRGFARHSSKTIGNFWVDLTRSTLYILMPLALIWSLLLVSQGVVQTFSEYKNVALTQTITYDNPKLDAQGNPIKDEKGNPVTEKAQMKEQVIPLGPAASQIAIKQLGTNGGGFFNVNSAHPFENPTPFSNFLEVLGILLISAALCFTFGKMVGDKRQGRALLAAMVIVLVVLMTMCVWSERQGNPHFAALGIDQTASSLQSGGNMEGKEARLGIVNSAIWATATTAASNGSVNAMHDSFTPIGGLFPMWLMQLGEVIFGGVGSGLYGMLIFAIITVFVAGLMVGRTPEYLGKKIEMFEMKMSMLAGTDCQCPGKNWNSGWGLDEGGCRRTLPTPARTGFPRSSTPFLPLRTITAVPLRVLVQIRFSIIRRSESPCSSADYWVIIPVLAIAGSLAKKKKVPAGLGTLPTHTPLFVTFLIGVILIVGALSFMPSLALGPIAEQLMSGK